MIASALLLSSLLAAAAAAAAEPAPTTAADAGAPPVVEAVASSGPTAEQIDAVFSSLASLPDVRARVVAASERFVGVPYQFDPLGEGPGNPPDEEPRLRFDRMDCQTFLETVLALAHAKTAGELLPRLDDVRYLGSPAYAHRNHFFEGQWVPANARKGYVRDATFAIAGKDAIAHVKVITRERWDQRTVGEKIALPEDRIPVGRFPMSYLPLKKVVERAKDIPSGTIFAVVRADKPLTPTMVSHLGLVVQKADGTSMRHAGKEFFNGVADEPVAHFVERNASYQKWPVLGLWLLEPVGP
ncbi:MAG TPA: N-acetylmuramoyl-L-alanine amidase-like domain-containing protein [Myxococcales bacterium]